MTLPALISGLAGALSSGHESEIASRVMSHWGSQDVLLTDSGTSALTLAIQLSAAGEKAVVAMPAYACYDLATAADGANANVVLYDVNPRTLAPEPASLARALARSPTALVAVHLYGIPVDTSVLEPAAESNGALLIEDAAQAIGAMHVGRPLGSFGPFAVLSFGRGKGLSGGSGGALLANEPRTARLLQRARPLLGSGPRGWNDVTRATAQYALGRPALYTIPASLPFLRLGETIYHPSVRPQPMSRAATRILAGAWNASMAATAGRRAVAQRFNDAAHSSGRWETLQADAAATPGFLRLPILVKSGTRDTVLNRAAAQLGIMPGYPLPLSRLSGFGERCLNREDSFPGAEKLARDLITLPTHALLTERDQELIEHWLRDPVRA
jgi:dTDP-4-amino-4,6-dideoxygalactose transaminase